MENIILYTGSDQEILLKAWQDDEKTIPVDIDDLDDFQVRIMIGGLSLGKWNKTGSGDFEQLTRINKYNYSLTLQTDDSTKTGHADLWVETQDADASLDDGINNGISAELNLFNVVQKSY